jgi:hypothetical protein
MQSSIALGQARGKFLCRGVAGLVSGLRGDEEEHRRTCETFASSFAAGAESARARTLGAFRRCLASWRDRRLEGKEAAAQNFNFVFEGAKFSCSALQIAGAADDLEVARGCGRAVRTENSERPFEGMSGGR